MREAREKRWHDAVRDDARQLGLLMFLAGIVGLFFEPLPWRSVLLLAIGLAVWAYPVYSLRKQQTKPPKPKPKRTHRRKS